MAVDELEELGDLDDGGRADDADAEALGDGELKAFRMRGVDVEEQRLVAGGADEGGAKVGDGFGKIVRDGLDDGAEGVHGDGSVWGDGVVVRKCVLFVSIWVLRTLTQFGASGHVLDP